MSELNTTAAKRWRIVTAFLLLAAIAAGASIYISGGSKLFTPHVSESTANIDAQITLPSEDALYGQDTAGLTRNDIAATSEPIENEVQAALRAALSADAQDEILLQNYFDRAAGDATALRERGHLLINALTSTFDASTSDPSTAKAARRIYRALDTTAETAYALPATFQGSHRLPTLSKGWDLGPQDKTAFTGYNRPEINRDANNPELELYENGPESLLINDGARNLNSLSLPSVQGARQVIILASSNLTASFGPNIAGIENSNTRLVSETSGIEGWNAKRLDFTSDGVSFGMDFGGSDASTLMAVIVPTIPVFGNLDIKFAPANTNIVAVLVGPTDTPQVISELKDELAPYLVSTEAVASANPQQKQPSPSSETSEISTLKGPITVDSAIAGAIAGTPEGLARLQKFMDAAAGDLERLKTRALALLDALGQSTVSDDFITLADAANRILAATSQASSSGYVLPAFLSDDFALPNDQTGWDFGPHAKPAFSDFTRIGETSSLVRGRNIIAKDGLNAPSVVNDALMGIDGFFPDMPDGVYRFLLLAPTSVDGKTVKQPFGFGLRIGGNAARLVDLSETTPLVWGRFNGDGISIQGGLEGPTPQAVLNRARQNGRDGAETGAESPILPDAMLVAVRGSVDAGRVRLEFDLTADQRSIVAGVIAGLSDPSDLEDFLADQIAILLAGTETAAGPGATAGAFLEPGTIPSLPSAPRAPNGPSPAAGSGTGGGTGGGTTGGTGGGTGGGSTDGGATDGGATDGGATDGGATDGGATDGGATDGGATDGGATDGGPTDGGATGGGATDGGATDGGATDGGATDGGATDGGATDGGATDGGATDGGATDGGATDGGATDGGATDGGATDGGATDGGATDGGATDGGATDGGTTDGGATDGGTTDGGATDGGATDGGATDGGATDGGATDGGTTDGGATDGGATDGGATDGGATDGGATDGGATDGGATDGGATDGGATDGGATDGGATDGGATDGGTTDGGATDGGATDGGATDGGATDGGATDGGATDGGATDGGATDGGATDGGTTDGGATDGGATDSGATDGGATDGGATDGGATDGGATDGGVTDGGATDGGDPLLSPDAGGPYTVFAGDEFALDGTESLFIVDDPALLSIDWLVNIDGETIFLASGFGNQPGILTPDNLSLLTPGHFDLTLRFSYLNLVEQAVTLIWVLPRNADIPVPASILVVLPGMAGLMSVIWIRRRRKICTQLKSAL